MEYAVKGLRLKDTKKKPSLEGAQFILTFDRGKRLEDAARNSHAILSALKGCGDMVLELNSRLLYTENEKDELIFQCIEAAKKLELEYRYRKLPPNGNAGILERLLNKAPPWMHELFIHIKDDKWMEEEIRNIIVPFGARYYITEAASHTGSLTEATMNMTDMEKLKNFKIIAFDMSILGQIGLNTGILSMEEVRKLLGLPLQH